MKKICVIGLGYIGLPTAAMFAAKQYEVIGVDVSGRVVDKLNDGKIMIEEPGLLELVKCAVDSKNLSGQCVPCEADVFIICVPTPINSDKTADMQYVVSAAQSIVPYLRKGNSVILESTSPPRTVEDLLCPILQKAGLVLGEELYVAHSPERVIPGRILEELKRNDRVVGGINDASSQAVKALYETIVEGNIYCTDATTAEMCKLMENTFRDVNIALANELAKISESLGVNAWEVIELANKHPRVNLHQPGPGVGGHCIAVDPWFVAEKAPTDAALIKMGRQINDNMPAYVVARINRLLDGLTKKKIVVLGATYKADVDDMRESPALEIARQLTESGAQVIIADPHVKKYQKASHDIINTAKDASLLFLAVNHQAFQLINLPEVAKVMQQPFLLDAHNFIEKKTAEAAGFSYHLLGAWN